MFAVAVCLLAFFVYFQVLDFEVFGVLRSVVFSLHVLLPRKPLPVHPTEVAIVLTLTMAAGCMRSHRGMLCLRSQGSELVL